MGKSYPQGSYLNFQEKFVLGDFIVIPNVCKLRRKETIKHDFSQGIDINTTIASRRTHLNGSHAHVHELRLKKQLTTQSSLAFLESKSNHNVNFSYG